MRAQPLANLLDLHRCVGMAASHDAAQGGVSGQCRQERAMPARRARSASAWERRLLEKRTMAMNTAYAAIEPARAEVDALTGPTVLEFGAPWCGICRAAQPMIAAALADHPQLRHLKIEDGPGRPLGRSFRIKLWPTLVFLNHGKEVARVVRPTGRQAIAEALAQQAADATSLRG